MDLERYKTEMDRLRARRQELERAAQHTERLARQERAGRSAIEHLERFCSQVSQGLEATTFQQRQKLLRLVVERITVQNGHVRIETVIPTGGNNGKLRNPYREPVEP